MKALLLDTEDGPGVLCVVFEKLHHYKFSISYHFYTSVFVSSVQFQTVNFFL